MSMENAWQRLKDAARQHARNGQPLTEERAREEVIAILRAEVATPVPPEATDILARELLAMTEESKV